VSSREELLVLNQATGRIANERMTAWPERREAVAFGEGQTFFCECGNTKCREPISLTPAEYEAVRADSRRFPVAPGHVYAEVERIVEEHDRYVVVEKFDAVAHIVRATDPRLG
jgi:hypothetical protein